MTDETTEKKSMTRDEMRAAIFHNSKPKSTEFTFFGVMIELRQPPMKAVMEAQAIAAENRGMAAAQMVVRYAYVPGTNDRVFEEADIDSILAMPFGKDLADLNVKIAELTNVDILGEEGNSEETQDSTMPTS